MYPTLGTSTVPESQLMVCYHDVNMQASYVQGYQLPDYNKTKELDLSEFERTHPGCRIFAVFCVKDNLMNKIYDESLHFYDVCHNYGFEPNDYRRPVKSHNGDTYLLVGFLPRNTKYKVLLCNPQTGGYIKATIDAVQKNIIRKDETNDA